MQQWILDKNLDKVIGEIETIIERVSKLGKKQKEQGQALQFYSDKIDDIKSQIQRLENEDIKDSVTKLKQEHSKKSLIVTGIPKKPKEDLLQIMTSTCSWIHAELDKNDVEQVFRMRSEAISVTFTSPHTRDTLQNGRKIRHKENITAKSLCDNTDNYLS